MYLMDSKPTEFVIHKYSCHAILLENFHDLDFLYAVRNQISYLGELLFKDILNEKQEVLNKDFVSYYGSNLRSYYVECLINLILLLPTDGKLTT